MSNYEPFVPQVPSPNGHRPEPPEPIALKKYKPPTKARQTAETIKVIVLKQMEFWQETYFTARQLKHRFPSLLVCSEKTVKRYLDEMHKARLVTIKEEVQRLSATKTVLRHLYKFCVTPGEWRDKSVSRKHSRWTKKTPSGSETKL